MSPPYQSKPKCMFVNKIDGCYHCMSLSGLLVMQQPPRKPQVEESVGGGGGTGSLDNKGQGSFQHTWRQEWKSP